ncbi:glycerophosphodiester phosphodiesterase-like protein [Cryptosporidium ryanae]|uniref:glycerophosphodiester phosphodiesterase-like protein n=1 Tax=Cryptosporidium ryanae TaxID=515981 RepID=UPI00351A6EFD|nr:glycerophosphodiester phosphodiesterase-like protein [Cryptosporidium ryanae]
MYLFLLSIFFVSMKHLLAQFHLVAHRGASFYVPEETKHAYELAAIQGAKFIECDVVSTKDGVLILRHSPNLLESTNIGDFSEFSYLMKTVELYCDTDSDLVNGIFSWDLTYEEIKKLRCTHDIRYKNRNQELCGVYGILTLDEFLEMNENGFNGYKPGVYIEIKYPSFHEENGINITDMLLNTLTKYGLNKDTDSVYIQSFEPENLRYIRERSQVRLVQLLTRDEKNSFVYAIKDSATNRMIYSPCDLKHVSTFANVVSPAKEDLIFQISQDHPSSPPDPDFLPNSSDFISRSHEYSLIVVPYTFRPESILSNFKDQEEEYEYFISILKSDGVFTDDPKGLVEYLVKKQKN